MGQSYSPDNPFAPRTPSYSPDNPFAQTSQAPGSIDLGAPRPRTFEQEEFDSPLAILGKSFAQGVLSLPRDITRVLGSEGGTDFYNRWISALEPRVGPASSPAFEAFARRHPILNQIYRGITQQGRMPPDVGIATIPADIQAAAAALGATAGEFGTGLGEYKGVEFGTKLAVKGAARVAPKLAAKAAERVVRGASRLSEAAGGGTLGTQLGGAAVQLPKQIAIGFGQQYVANPDEFGSPESVGLAVLFGFTGALADGVAFERFARQRGVQFTSETPTGTASSRAPEPVVPRIAPGGAAPRGATPAPPSGPPPAANKRVRDISDFDVVNSTPAEVQDLARRATTERKVILNGILGKTVARTYLSAQRIARSAASSPEAAASALQTLDRIQSRLTPEQIRAIEDVDVSGYTAARLRLIAKTVKGYDEATLATKDNEALLKDFGDVLMSPSYGSNISGLYRLQRLYTTLAARGVPPQDIISPITTYMQQEGVDPSEAMKAVVNRIVEIVGGVEKLRQMKDAGQAALGRPATESLDVEVADVVEQMATGSSEGLVGAGFDPSIFKKLGQNMYQGNIASVVVKEGLQNAIDAIVPKGSGKVTIDLNEEGREITISDNGIGMTPDIARNQFMDIGGSGKVSSMSAGGYGLAKVGLLANAQHFAMTTIAEHQGQRWVTKIEGSADDWANRRLKFDSRPVNPYDVTFLPGETGTNLKIQFEPEAKLDWASARAFLNRSVLNHLVDDVEIEFNSETGKRTSKSFKDIRDLSPPVIEKHPSADVEFYTASRTRPGWQTFIEFHILNNGIYQFSEIKYGLEGAGLPPFVLVNVKSRVGVDEADYPFTTSRESLKGTTVAALSNFIANIKQQGSRKEAELYRSTIMSAPRVPDTSFFLLAPGMPVGIVETVGFRNYTSAINKILSQANDTITEAIQTVSPRIEPALFAGFGFEKGYLGINIRFKAINKIAEETGAEKIPYDQNLILFNPFTSIHEIIERPSFQLLEEIETKEALFNQQLARELATLTWGTMVHEVTHQLASGHGIEFSQAITRAVGPTVGPGAIVIPLLEKQYLKALEEGLFDDYTAVSEHWRNEDSIFAKVSGHLDPDLPRNAPGSGGREIEPRAVERLSPSSGEGRPLSRGALGPGKALGTSARSGGTGAERSSESRGPDSTEPVESTLRENSETLKSFGADVFETKTGSLPPWSRRIQNKMLVGPRPENKNSGWWLSQENLGKAYSATIDRFHALSKFDKALGIKVPAERSVYIAARMTSGIAGRVHQFLVNEPFVMKVDGSVEFTGNKSLTKILAPFRGRLNELRRALVATKAQELHNLGKATGFDPADVTMELANAPEDIKKAVAEHSLMLRDAKRYAEEFGLIDKEMSTLLDFMGSSHISWERVFDKSVTKNRVRYTALNVENLFKEQGDNPLLKIVDPFQTSVDYVRRLLRAADLNRIGLLMVEWAEERPEALKGLIEPVNRKKNVSVQGDKNLAADGRTVRKAAREAGIDISSETAKEIAALMSDSNLKVENDQIVVRRNGKGEMWKVAPEIGQALRGLSPSEMHFLVRALGFASNIVKAGITLDPTFAITQAFIGSFHSAMQSKNGFRLGIDSFIGLTHKLRNSREYQQFLAAGGAFGHIGAVEVSSGATFRSVLPKTAAGSIKEVTLHPAEALRKLLQPWNEANQIGEFLRATGRGKSALEAAFDARNIDTDFAVIGLKMQGLAHATHFLNPYIQGSRTFAETFSRRPNGYQLAALAGITLTSIYLWLAAEDDEDVRAVQLSPTGQNNWIVRIGDEIVKIRKPILWGHFFGNTAELALTKMREDSPEAYSIFLDGLSKQVLFQGMPSLVQLGAGLWANTDPVTGAPIVPEGPEVEPRYQLSGNESQLAKEVGSEFNISPAKLEFAIRQLTGTGGAAIARSLDVVIPNGEISRPSPVSADWPLMSRFFVRYPSSAAEPIRTFYDRATRLQKVANTALLLEKKITTAKGAEEYKAYVREHKPELALAPIYASSREELAAMRRSIEEINSLPDRVVSADRKRELNDYYLENMIDFARRINTSTSIASRYRR